jgi:hypothetical protein
MTIREQLEQLSQVFGEWAGGETVRGAVEIASDPAELEFKLAQRPGGTQVYIVFQGEDKRGEFEEMGAVDRKFLVVVSRGGKAMAARGSDATMKGTGGGRALFDLVEEARQVGRGVQFAQSTEVTMDSRSCAPYIFADGSPANAYVMEFWIGVQLPAA